MELIYDNGTMPLNVIQEYRISIAIPILEKLKYYDYDYELPYKVRLSNETEAHFRKRCEDRDRKYSKLDKYIIDWENRKDVDQPPNNDWELANAKIPLNEVWKFVPQNIDDPEIFDYPIRYEGVSPNQYLYKYGKRKIYVTESKQYHEVLNQILEKSQDPELHNSFGKGANNIKKLLVKIFERLYPRNFFSNDDEFFEHINNRFKKNYQLIIYSNEDYSYRAIMIPLYRKIDRLHDGDFLNLKGDERFDFTGGILHYLRHLQLNGKPISSLNKTLDGDFEYDKGKLFGEIIDGVEKCIQGKESEVAFTTSTGENKIITIYKKKISKKASLINEVIFVNTIH
jgi:hypothetical protein